MGVEVGDFGKAVAYHLLGEHPGDHEFVNSYSRKHVRVPADQMLHVFLPERAHQTRGVPMLATAIGALKMLHGYREAGHSLSTSTPILILLPLSAFVFSSSSRI